MRDLSHYYQGGEVHIVIVDVGISLNILSLALTVATSEEQLKGNLH
jgi:hypothetical protein